VNTVLNALQSDVLNEVSGQTIERTLLEATVAHILTGFVFKQ
jgi:hypothetical protein